MRRAALAAVWAVVAAASGCNEQFRFDPPRDTGVDAGLDAGVDAGLDAGDDASPDACGGCGLTLRCDQRSQQCYECILAADCGSPGDGATWGCLDHLCWRTCEWSGDCPLGADDCEEGRGTCEPCEEGRCTCDAGCGQAGGHCDRRTDQCVECLHSSDCPAERPWCDPDAMACVTDG